jgi:hypothetical protein
VGSFRLSNCDRGWAISDYLYAQKLLGDAVALKESTSPEQVAQTETRCRSPVRES